MSYIGKKPAGLRSSNSYIGPTPSALSIDTFTGDGSTTGFTLSESINTNEALIFIDGVQQNPTDAYSISGTTLTFTGAPSSSSDIVVRYDN